MAESGGTVCVTGATGFIGAHVARRLARSRGGSKRTVRVTFRYEQRLRALSRDELQPVAPNAPDGPSFLEALKGCELLFHTAGTAASLPPPEVSRGTAVAPIVAVEWA